MREQPDQLTIVTSDYLSKERYKVTSDYNSDYRNTKRNKKSYTEQLAQSRARYIAGKLNNPTRMLFYLKCAWNLTDEYLDRLLSISLTKTSPVHYFSASAAREMRKNS